MTHETKRIIARTSLTLIIVGLVVFIALVAPQMFLVWFVGWLIYLAIKFIAENLD